MEKLFSTKKKFAIAHALRRVRNAFHDAMQEVRSEIVAEVKDDNDLPKVREEFNNFSITIANAVKSFDFCKKDNLVIAETKKGSIADVLRIAIEAHHKGHEEEALKLFQYAAFNTTDLHLDNLPNSLVVQNSCPSCGSALPTVCNFCPICGNRLQNQLSNNEISPLTPMAPQQHPLTLTQPNTVPQQQQMPTPLPQMQTLPPIIMSAVRKLIEAGRSDEAFDLILNSREDSATTAMN